MITPAQLKNELDRLSSVSGAEFDEEARLAWYDVLSNLSPVVLTEAVTRYLNIGQKYPTPALIKQYASEIASSKLSRVTEPLPPDGLDVHNYQIWKKAWRDAILAGAEPQAAEATARATVGR